MFIELVFTARSYYSQDIKNILFVWPPISKSHRRLGIKKTRKKNISPFKFFN